MTHLEFEYRHRFEFENRQSLLTTQRQAGHWANLSFSVDDFLLMSDEYR